MRVELWSPISKGLRDTNFSDLTVALNEAARRHDPNFGVASEFLNKAVLHFTLLVQPASVVPNVLAASIASMATWARELELDLVLACSPSSPGILIKPSSGAGQVSRTADELSQAIQESVEEATLQEARQPNFANIEPKELCDLVSTTTGLEPRGLVRKYDLDHRTYYIMRTDRGWIRCWLTKTGWTFWELKALDQKSTRVWSSFPSWVGLNLCLELDNLDSNFEGLDAVFLHMVMELEQGIERKHFRTREGLIIVHTRLLESDGLPVTEMVIERGNPRRYDRTVRERGSVHRNYRKAFTQLGSRPF